MPGLRNRLHRCALSRIKGLPDILIEVFAPLIRFFKILRDEYVLPDMPINIWRIR